MNPAAPEGTPPRRISAGKYIWKHRTAPPCLGEALRRGPPEIAWFNDFHSLGANSRSRRGKGGNQIHVPGFSMKKAQFRQKLKNRLTIKEGTVPVLSLDPPCAQDVSQVLSRGFFRSLPIFLLNDYRLIGDAAAAERANNEFPGSVRIRQWDSL